MQKVCLIIKSQKGFSVAEIIVASAVFVLFVTIFTGILVSSINGLDYSGTKNRAIILAEEGLEATRSIRDSNFSNLVDGTYGINNNGAQWVFIPTQDIVDNYFTRKIIISSIDANTKSVISVVDWNNLKTNGSVSLLTHFANWQRRVSNMSENFIVDISGVFLSNSNRRLSGITLSNVGSDDLVIAEVIVSWSGVNPNRRITAVVIDGSTLWTGSANSGTTLDITDFTLNAGTMYPLTYLGFNNSMNEGTFSITFNMSDGTSKTVSNIVQ